MPRKARVVIPGLAHHVTQRGNKGAVVFENNDDRVLYLDLLKFYAQKAHMQIASYCLMDTHPHLMAIPHYKDSLWKTFKPTHMRYSQHLNRRNEEKGHNWQGRFFSSPMDESYTYNTFLYIALNPVKAGLVDSPEKYEWSSARAHMKLAYDQYLTAQQQWIEMSHRAFIDIQKRSPGNLTSKFEYIEKQTMKNYPIGSEDFIHKIETQTGVILREKKTGRPFKTRDGSRFKSGTVPSFKGHSPQVD